VKEQGRGMRLVSIFAMVLIAVSNFAVAQEFDDSDAQPLSPPVPTYPVLAAVLGLDGLCSVRFSVDQQGLPFNLFTSCTEPVFCYEAKRAVSEVRFKPVYVNGHPRIREDVVYPIEFRLEQGSPEATERASARLAVKTEQPCQKIPVS